MTPKDVEEMAPHDELGEIPREVVDIKQRCTRVNPFESATVCGRESYHFLKELLDTGYERPLEESDIYECIEEDRAELLTSNLKAAWLEQREKDSPSLMGALWSVFGWSYAWAGVIGVIEWAAAIAEPFFVSQLLELFIDNDEGRDPDEGDMWMYAGLFVGCSLVRAFLHHPFFYRCQHTGMQVRIACVGLIYEKVLNLSNRALSQTTTGHLVNLVSNDVERFDQSLPFLHFLIIGPIKTGVIAYFMYTKMGLSALAGIGFCLLLVPLQFFMGKTFAKLRQASAAFTDKRVKYMNELIVGIRLIKMYAWETPFAKTILGVREDEASKLQKTANLRAFNAGFFFITTPLITFIIISIFTHTTSDDLKPSDVFACVMYINVLRISVSLFIPEAIKNGSEALVSITRLQDFLMKEEFQKNRIVQTMPQGVAIKFDNVSCEWQEGVPVLKDVTMDVQQGQLIGVMGVVGAGKTSLLSAMLGELPALSGSVSLSCRPTFAAQEVWINSDTVRSNIIFGREFNKDRYHKVVDACCLYPDFEQLADGDQTMIGERGITLSGGQRARISLARACYQGGDIYLLDDPLSAVDTIVGRHIYDKCINGILKNKTRVLVTHQHQFLPSCETVYELSGQRLVVKDVSAIVQDEAVEDKRATDEAKQVISSGAEGQLTTEEKATGTVSSGTFSDYFKNGGSVRSWLFFILGIGAQTMFVLSDVWLSRWTDRPKNDQDSAYHYRVYCIAIGILIVLGLSRAILFFKLAITSSTVFHAKMFNAVLRSPVSFFDTNPSGRVLNRFAKDLGQMDELLPWIFFDTVQQVLLCFGGVVIVSVVNPWVLLTVAPLLLIFFFMRKYFVASAREVKRLEANARSPLYSMFSEGISGLHTIRAFGRTEHFLSRYKAAQNDHNSSFFLFLTCNRWIGLRLDLMSWFFITCVTVAAVLAKDTMSGGDVAISLTYATALAGSFQWCVRQSAETENHMTAVERVRAYTHLTTEAAAETSPDVNLPDAWPSEGAIEFKDYTLRYREGLPEVLKGVSCKIDAGSKVGVVGRTGAGKSSLMQALFRLVEPSGGSIIIDGFETTKLGLYDLRSRCSVIPQDPILFTGSLRYNLDPFGMVDNDRMLWKALEDVQLKEVAQEIGGLEFEVSEGGKNFSVGQRQLVCLARAILRKSKILMMDEATANVDPETDAVIQETVRKSFVGCTVLTIAHRLHTVIDSDKILVLSAGQVAAFGQPHELLQDEDNLLTKFVNQTGMEASLNLKEAAFQASVRKSPKEGTSPY